MSSRVDVEQAIVDDESMLEQVIGLLESRSDIARWTEDTRTALALALQDGSMSPTESWKAVTLRRHLFGPTEAIPDQLDAPPHPSVIDLRRAERLRSGLPACVRYRAGTYLLPPVERRTVGGARRPCSD